ncbi:MAG: PQQ-binding-like beta-propeller repeat protein [Pirellulaceae bacterium]|jgi:hypothetical protein|nr:PQQ-binding-like beta-propeller repeat protein [Pirellulaceae bacterium]MDP7018083.1 PQQ-binding-like beta-propeller repeat protein [Pirellulaceae bacterium]
MMTPRTPFAAILLPSLTCLLCCCSITSVGLAESPSPAEPASFKLASTDWPWWRGPNRDGAVAGDAPTTWSATENIKWTTPLPGRGHASATIVGPFVYIPTADKKARTQTVYCLDRETGRIVWAEVVHAGGLDDKGNKKTTQANASIACDGEKLYVNFLNSGSVHTTALTLKGKRVWSTEVSKFTTHQGFGASPALYGDLVITSADNKGGGAVAAMKRSDGEVVWRIDRPAKANYTSPIILKSSGRDQLFLSGCDLVTSLQPESGKTLWEIEGSTTECVTSMVTDGKRVFASGGYPKNHMLAVNTDGSGEVAWSNNVRVYVPSMLLRGAHLYGVTDAGVATCWDSATGETMWQERLGGVFTSSLILVGEKILATNEKGETFVFRADPQRCRILAKNQLGDASFATMSASKGALFHRYVKTADGERSEFVTCIEE